MCFSVLQYYFILVIILFFFNLTLGELKKCSEESDKYLELCVKGEKYVRPIPAALDTALHLNQIYDVDGHGNSITIHIEK